MSSTGSTRPTPKRWAQTRLTAARAKKGFSGETIHSARIVRVATSGRQAGKSAVEEGRLHDLLVPGTVASRRLGNFPDRAGQRHGRGGALRLQAGEERRIAPELFTGPRGERVVVALGAFEPETQEQPGRARREVLSLHFLGEIERQGRRLLVRAPRPGTTGVGCRERVGNDGDGQQFAYDLIIADIRGDLLAEPGLERRRDQPQLPVRVGLGDHQPPLDGREMRHVRRPVEQAIDQPPPLLRARVLEELVRLSGRRDLDRRGRATPGGGTRRRRPAPPARRDARPSLRQSGGRSSPPATACHPPADRRPWRRAPQRRSQPTPRSRPEPRSRTHPSASDATSWVTLLSERPPPAGRAGPPLVDHRARRRRTVSG